MNKNTSSIWSIQHSKNLVKEHSKTKEIFKTVYNKKTTYLDKYPAVIQTVIKDLIEEEKYNIFINNFVDNIFVFYKIVKNKLFIISIKGDAVYIKNPDDFVFNSYSFNINNINIANSENNLVIKKNKNSIDIIRNTHLSCKIL